MANLCGPPRRRAQWLIVSGRYDNDANVLKLDRCQFAQPLLSVPAVKEMFDLGPKHKAKPVSGVPAAEHPHLWANALRVASRSIGFVRIGDSHNSVSQLRR